MSVTLPDGSPLELPEGATGADAAAAIGPGLARAALAVKQNGHLRDLGQPLAPDEPVEIVTERSGQDALDLIRHDAAQVLATAVMELYPGVKVSIGPPIENGFYYDFDFPEGVTVSDADFEAIEAKMREHIAADEMLTRVYGTAFFKQAELDAFLEQLELARARDHRKLGRELGLFAFSPLSPGSTFWLPKGTAVFNALVALNRRMQQERGYVEVKTPLLYESQLWMTSGHWDKYKENIFVAEYEDRDFGLKPMNCPGHCALFGMQQWS